jgi:CubicO group peptidase (beta-lactamase class C family)
MSNGRDELQEQVSALAGRHEVPGVAVGVYVGGEESYAFHGVTSVENPLEVDAGTLFEFGSTGKTFTAVALMRLVDRGTLELDAPVRTYVPELRLRDEEVARSVTVLQLLNHTAGWDGDDFEDTGEGDDALARYVEHMADLAQVTPLGAGVSYNNASLSLAGRVIEKLTGGTYEQAIAELIFEPLGLEHSFFFRSDIMIRRFAVGHHRSADGSITVSRGSFPRASAPGGGISSNAEDQISWARFHLSGGKARDGSEIVPESLIRSMQEPTVRMPGSALGDAVGISWLLRDVDDERVVSHGGSTIGQYSIFEMVPARDFALISLTNSGPNGTELNEELRRWAFEHYLGIVERDPEPVPMDEDALSEYVGTYETIASVCEITIADGGLALTTKSKPAALEQLGEDPEEDEPPMPLGLLAGPGDRYVVREGPYKGMKGYFLRDAPAGIWAVHVGGRIATRADGP